MSSVYLAIKQGTDVPQSPVALKLLTLALEDEPEFVERFKREAAVTQKLQHPNIVPTIDYGEDHEHGLYLTMPYIDGGNLRQMVTKAGNSPPLSLDKAKVWLEQCCAGLDYAHQQGVIHRDLKPENILIDSSGGQVLIADFGVARVDAGTKLTRTGLMPGTPEYMSPELFGETGASPSSDVYSLALVFYELLTGVAPFRCDNVAKTIQKQAYEKPTELSEALRQRNFEILESGPRQALDQVFAKALEKEAGQRYSSAGQFYQSLLAALATAPSPAELPKDGPSDTDHIPTTMVQWKLEPEKSLSPWLWLIPTLILLGAFWLNWSTVLGSPVEQMWTDEGVGYSSAPSGGTLHGALVWEGLEVALFRPTRELSGIDQARRSQNLLTTWIREDKVTKPDAFHGELISGEYIISGPDQLVRIDEASASEFGASPTQVGTYWLACLKDITEMRLGNAPHFVQALERERPLRKSKMGPFGPRLENWFDQARILKKDGPLQGDFLPRALLGMTVDSRREICQMAREVPLPIPKRK